MVTRMQIDYGSYFEYENYSSPFQANHVAIAKMRSDKNIQSIIIFNAEGTILNYLT